MNLGRNSQVSNWPSRELLEEHSRRSWVIKLNWYYNEAEHVWEQIYDMQLQEAGAGGWSDLFNLTSFFWKQAPISEHKSIHSARADVGLMTTTQPPPTAQSCLPWSALPKEMLCKATKSQHQNPLPLKSNPTGLSFWKSLLWIYLSFYFSDCKDEDIFFFS